MTTMEVKHGDIKTLAKGQNWRLMFPSSCKQFLYMYICKNEMKIQLWKVKIKETINENKDISIVNMKRENVQCFYESAYCKICISSDETSCQNAGFRVNYSLFDCVATTFIQWILLIYYCQWNHQFNLQFVVPLIMLDAGKMELWPCLSKKAVFWDVFSDPHYKDQTIVRPSYL